MIVYKVIHERMGEDDLEEIETVFESFWQAQFWARELECLGLPVRWEFDFIDAPKQYEFMF